MTNAQILIADDQSHIRQSLDILLAPKGYEIVEADSPDAVLHLLDSRPIQLVLMDMNYAKDTTSGDEGIALIKKIRDIDPVLPIITMTAWANVELSVKAIKQGANDFIEKPWNNARLLSLIANQLALASTKQSNIRLTAAASRGPAEPDIIANAKSMEAVMSLIERTAASDANILLTGESGVGKSLFAGVIHHLSSRNTLPMVSVNMGALSDSLFESELFGHQKGAFTDAKANRMGRFEMADKGTLFLDEIANIPMGLQGKLLRVLESGEFEPLGSSKTKRADVRVISASNVNFDDELAAGRFRQDLLYRLNTITIEIPPLRQRIEDIVPIAERFLSSLRQKYRRPEINLSEDAKLALRHHTWPGNVRELSHCVERAVLMATGSMISVVDLGLQNSPSQQGLDNMTLEQAEHYLITRALSQSEGNILAAAQKLGISRAALYRRLEKYADIIDTDIKE